MVRRPVFRRMVWGGLTALLLPVVLNGVAYGDATSPTVSPVTGGNGVPVLFAHTAFDLATVGYAQRCHSAGW